MAVFIRGNQVRIAGQNDNVGVFIGQNVQTGWDSFSPMKVATGFNMGDFSASATGFSYYLGAAMDWQSVHDEDAKGNYDVRAMR